MQSEHAEEDVSLTDLNDQVQVLRQEVSGIQNTLAKYGMTPSTRPVQPRPQPRPQPAPIAPQVATAQPVLATAGGPPSGLPADDTYRTVEPEEPLWD
ncbi:MAG: hypothetical protein QF898_08115, partial [SAR202 cluster bacterium]|nr:hypothetical protein [SAR202 cluster bacterium]